MKFVLIAIVILVIAFWLSRGKKAAGSRAMRAAARATPPIDARPAEDIVHCAHCGLHFPASEAVAGADGERYCTEAHRRLGGRAS